MAVCRNDGFEKSMTVFPAHMRDIDNRQRVGRFYKHFVSGGHCGQPFAAAQDRQRALEPSKIKDGPCGQNHSLAQNFQKGFFVGSSGSCALKASGLTAGTGTVCVAAAGAARCGTCAAAASMIEDGRAVVAG